MVVTTSFHACRGAVDTPAARPVAALPAARSSVRQCCCSALLRTALQPPAEASPSSLRPKSRPDQLSSCAAVLCLKVSCSLRLWLSYWASWPLLQLLEQGRSRSVQWAIASRACADVRIAFPAGAASSRCQAGWSMASLAAFILWVCRWLKCNRS